MQGAVACLCQIVLAVALVGCERDQAGPASGEGGLRIASLSPAMTTMAIDLGLEDALVGRTPYCRGLSREVPVVGSLDEVDAEMLLQVSPDALLVQRSGPGMLPGLAALAEDQGYAVVNGTLDDIDDVANAVKSISRLSGREDVLAAAEDWQRKCDGLGGADSDVSGPDCLLLYGVDPFGVAGRGTYLDEILELAGGRNAMPRTGWLEVSVEEILALDPNVVIVFGRETDPLQ
ncbi:MAG: ABC transporter substrate-binding protein, partial [Phycisphaerales bacterium]|nr:ABC transporter substrate-binding protein [Phycisphaerales bacterium]